MSQRQRRKQRSANPRNAGETRWNHRQTTILRKNQWHRHCRLLWISPLTVRLATENFSYNVTNSSVRKDGLLPAYSSYPLHQSLKRSLHSLDFKTPTAIQKRAWDTVLTPDEGSAKDLVGVAETVYPFSRRSSRRNAETDHFLRYRVPVKLSPTLFPSSNTSCPLRPKRVSKL
jgi:hypothetical protein